MKLSMDGLIAAAMSHFNAPVEVGSWHGVDYVKLEWSRKIEDVRAALAAWDEKYLDRMPAGVVITYRLV